MKDLFSSVKRLINDESGNALTEYAFMLGLVILLALSAIVPFGGMLVTRWANLTNLF